MGIGNRNSGIEGSSSSSSLECDVGLGLKMQNTESFPSHLPYHHHLDSNTTSSCSSSFSGVYGGRSSSSGPSVFQRTSSDTTFKSSGKILFTASQWQELERQTLICKYIMASIPVPPQLLITTKSTPQSNSGGLDLRFSSGSDLEPWRCRRTDGKKWRCSRDVAPEQKYCERHAHKTRTRSRKPVENQNQNQTQISNKGNNNYTNRPPILPVYTPDPFQIPVSHFLTPPASATSFDPPRCTEWFMKGGTTTNQQYHHQSSSSLSRSIGFKRDITDHAKNPNPNISFFNQYEDEHQTPLNFIDPYMNGQDSPGFESHQLTNCLDETTHTTRHFIDAWSNTVERDTNNNNNNNNNNVNLNYSARKLPLSSLTLSMSGSDQEENVEGEREFLKSHWLNPAMWMGSPPPGGPLGEALCLGPAAPVSGPNLLSSPRGFSNSNSTSSCSKNSCDDVGQGLNFH